MADDIILHRFDAWPFTETVRIVMGVGFPQARRVDDRIPRVGFSATAA